MVRGVAHLLRCLADKLDPPADLDDLERARLDMRDLEEARRLVRDAEIWGDLIMHGPPPRER